MIFLVLRGISIIYRFVNTSPTDLIEPINLKSSTSCLGIELIPIQSIGSVGHVTTLHGNQFHYRSELGYVELATPEYKQNEEIKDILFFHIFTD